MKINELREMSTEELTEKLASCKQELFQLRFQNAINQLENPQKIGGNCREGTVILAGKEKKA